jgi:hypothetical protein
MQTYPQAMQAHPRAMQAHPGAMEAFSGAMETHPGGLCDKKSPLAYMFCSGKVKMCRVDFCKDFCKEKIHKLFYQTKNYMTQNYLQN